MTRSNVRRAILVALSLGTAILAGCADVTAPNAPCDSGTYGGSGTKSCPEYSGTYGGSGT